MSARGVEALLDGFQAAWSTGEDAAFEAVCTEDVHYEDPLLDGPLEGPGQLAARSRTLLASFPDARVEATGPRMVSDRHVAAPCKIVATHRGDLGDALPATGRFVVVQAVVVCELHPERDALWRVRPFFDVWGAGAQIGAVPARGTFGERALLMLRGFGLRARS